MRKYTEIIISNSNPNPNHSIIEQFTEWCLKEHIVYKISPLHLNTEVHIHLPFNTHITPEIIDSCTAWFIAHKSPPLLVLNYYD
jgi:hypothetical protein